LGNVRLHAGVGPYAQPPCHPLTQHDDREIRDGTWNRRDHGCVHDPEVFDAADMTILIDDGTGVALRSHPRRAERVTVRADVFEDVAAEKIIGTDDFLAKSDNAVGLSLEGP
jgi:hypothetical protein